MATCHQVAEYFLAKQDADSGDLISNLKLQKLAYYAQGFCLAMHDRPLFAERIEAWTHGPVVPDLYHAYSKYEGNAIPNPETVDVAAFSKDEIDLMEEVYSVYGQFSAWKLRNMTHDEPPWAETPRSQVIPHDLLREYFATQLQ